jgi:hypothetical protein
MDTVQVTAIVQDVIVHYGLPFKVLSVIGSQHGWDIMVRAESGRTIPFTVADGRPVYVRETIQAKLEAEF